MPSVLLNVDAQQPATWWCTKTLLHCRNPPHTRVNYLGSLPSAGALGVSVCVGSGLDAPAMGAVQALLQTSVHCTQRNKPPSNLKYWSVYLKGGVACALARLTGGDTKC
jgi:hypothetical protein